VDNAIGIAQLATLLTAAGVGIYVLGLVGLALSINLTHAEKWSTAWYAVSLMPRTVVAGQGVRIWRQGWIRIVTMVGWLPMVAALNYVGSALNAFKLGEIGALLVSIVPALNAIGLGVIGLLFVLIITLIVISIFLYMMGRLTEWLTADRKESKGDDNAPPHPHLSRLTAASLWAIGIGMSISGGYLALRGLQLNSADGPANWDIITVAFLLVLVGAFFVAIPAADRMSNPLPMVMLIGAGEDTPNRVGWLVAHSDGYWHLFDSRHVLLSVPDERVIEARVDDPGISEQLEASSKSTEQLRQAPPQKKQ
jgi:hypothetical protein